MRQAPIATLRSFLRSETGSTAIEYSLVAALIAVVIVGAVSSVGTNLQTLFYDKIVDGF